MRQWKGGVAVLAAVLLIGTVINYALAQSRTGTTEAPAGVAEYSFRLVLDGAVAGQFTGIAGMDSETEVVDVVEYRDGDDPVTRKRPGRTKYANITLVRGWDPKQKTMEQWRADTVSGKAARKSGSIIILDRDGQEVARYNFFEAWPTRHTLRWMAPEALSERSGHMVEEIEFVVEKVERAS